MPDNFTTGFGELGLYSRVIRVTCRYFARFFGYIVGAPHAAPAAAPGRDPDAGEAMAGGREQLARRIVDMGAQIVEKEAEISRLSRRLDEAADDDIHSDDVWEVLDDGDYTPPPAPRE